jgi:hypothetical protein
MNYNKKVVQFVFALLISLLALSVYIVVEKINNPQLQNISILSDIFTNKKAKKIDSIHVSTKIEKVDTSKVNLNNLDSSYNTLHNFTTPNRLTNFSIDTTKIVAESFIQKLIALKKTKKGKIRIAYLGDSMIEGDLVSQTLRKKLQEYFGGEGVGFVPITSPVAGFRTSVKHSFSAKWKESSFRNRISVTPLYLSGKTFFSMGYNWMEATDNTYIKRTQPLEKYLLCGYKALSGRVAVNGSFNAIKPTATFNKILMDKSVNNKIKLEISDGLLPLYGISFETENGVIVDNFSYRGSGGFEFVSIDTSFLKQVSETQPFDLIIMQYGVNVLNHPNNNNFNWYYKAMLTSITNLKKCFPKTDFVLISTADKSFRYSDGTHTAIGMDSLIATQEKISFEMGMAFFNTYNSMGGYNSMVDWVNRNPRLAAKDYTHLNAKGAEVLGNGIFDGIMYEYQKANK